MFLTLGKLNKINVKLEQTPQKSLRQAAKKPSTNCHKTPETKAI
jgi:hypothetical protein